MSEKTNIIDLDLLKELKGSELNFNCEIVGIEYPYIINGGIKKKLSFNQWKDLLNQFFDNPSNEGYWLIKELKEEFGF